MKRCNEISTYRPRSGAHPALLLTLSLALAASCAGGDKSAADVCSDRANVECDKIAECTKDYNISVRYGTKAACIADIKSACVVNVERKGSGASVSYVEKCTAAMKAQSCADRMASVVLTACAPVAGEFKDAAKCIGGSQCVSTYCKLTVGVECGACTPRKAAGEECGVNGDCLMGHLCQRDLGVVAPAPGKCVKRAAAGEPCGPTVSCETELSCQGGSATVMGKCVARTQKAGDPCNAEKVCVPGTQCIGAVPATMIDGKCVALGAKVGDMCDRRGGNSAVAPNCDTSIGFYCNQANTPNATTGAAEFAMPGTCQKRMVVGAGQPCGLAPDGSDPVCGSEGNCQRPLREGTMTPDTTKQGKCVAVATTVGALCNTSGDIGPGCGSGITCLRTNPTSATDTAGKCVNRTYELSCK